MGFGALISKLSIFVLLMVVGYTVARMGIADKNFAKTASFLTLNIFLTGTILNSAITDMPELSGRELFVSLGIIILTEVMMYLVAIPASKLLKQSGEYRGLSTALLAVSNNMFVAFPVVSQLYGSEAMFYVSLSCLPMNLLLYTYGVWSIRSGEEKLSLHWKEVFSMPLISTIAAILLFLFKIQVPALGREIIGTLSAATLPLSMLVVGTSLGSIKLRDAFSDRQTYLIAAIRLLVCPVIVWLVVRLLTDNPALLAAAVITAASPSGIIVTSLSISYGKDAVYTSKNILASTVLSMLTIPLIVYILHL